MTTATAHRHRSVVLHVGGLHYASQKAIVERVLANRPGVVGVDANPVAQTATVEYDPEATTVEALHQWVEECGFHCAGRPVPGHVCDPLAEQKPLAPARDHAATERADEADGHGHGGHAGMSMAAMVREMRNRFLVALVFAILIAIWSPMGESLFGSTPATPFGIGAELWQLLLSLPVILYSSSIFFVGAWNALRAKTLDMMVWSRSRSAPRSSTRSLRPSGSRAMSSMRRRRFWRRSSSSAIGSRRYAAGRRPLMAPSPAPHLRLVAAP